MHRLIVAFLSAFDAAIAVAVGVAATLATLTLVWVFALGDTADWSSLWPASAVIWQLGHLVPLHITLAGDYLAEAGIAEDAASFVLSLAPLAFATFTAIFAWRSGARASRAGAWGVGVVTSALVVGVLASLIATSSANPVASASLWQAVLFPILLFAVPALVGGTVTEWREASEGWLARVRDRVEASRGGWGVVPGVIVRASAAALVGLIGAGALLLSVAFAVRAGDIVALYQAGNFDALGAIVVTLAQLAYLPTLVVWGVAFVTGPGFSVGDGTAVSPAGTQAGVLPGIPALGFIPESSTSWLLLVVLIPIAVGAFAGWLARSHMAAAADRAPSPWQRNAGDLRAGKDAATAAAPAVASPAKPVSLDPAQEERRAALAEMLAGPSGTGVWPRTDGPRAEGPPGGAADPFSVLPTGTAPALWSSAPEPVVEPVLPRLVVAVAIAALSAGGAAVLAVFASGSLGPGRLAHVGPAAGPVALAAGLEILVGAAIMLLSSRSASRRGDSPGRDTAETGAALEPDPHRTASPAADAPAAPIVPRVEPDADTAAIDVPNQAGTGSESASVD